MCPWAEANTQEICICRIIKAVSSECFSAASQNHSPRTRGRELQESLLNFMEAPAIGKGVCEFYLSSVMNSAPFIKLNVCWQTVIGLFITERCSALFTCCRAVSKVTYIAYGLMLTHPVARRSLCPENLGQRAGLPVASSSESERVPQTHF